MTFTVLVSARAQDDAQRLDDWLSAKDTKAASRLGALLEGALVSLTETPERGRLVGRTAREINIPFGQSAYIIRYRVTGQRVIVTRIWHGLEQR